MLNHPEAAEVDALSMFHIEDRDALRDFSDKKAWLIGMMAIQTRAVQKTSCWFVSYLKQEKENELGEICHAYVLTI